MAMQGHYKAARFSALLCFSGMISLLALPMFVQAQPTAGPAKPPFELKEIGPGVYAAIDIDGGAGSNAGFVIGDDGVLVIDTFFTPKAAEALLADIRRLTPKPIKYVVNTHYHIDHVSGDALFRAAGAVVIAHRNVRGWIHDENIHLMGGDKTDAAVRAKIAALPEPDLTTDQPLTVWLGSRRVNVQPLEGHTGGDLTVGVPDAKVIFCGDLLWRKNSPNIIDGVISKWTATLALFGRLPDAAAITYVPGHGGLARAADVAEMENFFGRLSSVTKDAEDRGLSGAALVSDAAPRLAAAYPDWKYIEPAAPRLVTFMDEELRGVKRTPAP